MVCWAGCREPNSGNSPYVAFQNQGLLLGMKIEEVHAMSKFTTHAVLENEYLITDMLFP